MTEGSGLPKSLLAARTGGRLIPFVGAGMSVILGLPGWTDLLRNIAVRLRPDLDYDAVSHQCGGDPLRIAEYLFIIAGKEIGPLRQRMSEQLFAQAVDPTVSTAHVELVNLNATRVYTTNYDDMVERTFSNLGLPYHLVATPRHIAQSDGHAVEIVKFHGDLQWEHSLVFTESSYFSRLQLESPLDIKLRSDLLGSSVIFLGYGFSDVNVRLMWHRLIKMMQGVDPDERPRSFIVRMHPNPALAALDADAGIETIVLTSEFGEAPTERLGEFLRAINDQAEPRTNTDWSAFISGSLADEVKTCLTEPAGFTDGEKAWLVEQLGRRRIPGSLREKADQLLAIASRLDTTYARAVVTALAPNYADHFGVPAADQAYLPVDERLEA